MQRKKPSSNIDGFLVSEGRVGLFSLFVQEKAYPDPYGEADHSRKKFFARRISLAS